MSINDQALVVAVAAIFAGLLCASLSLRVKPSASTMEPPAIPQRTPYVGHLIGLIRHKNKYYDQVKFVTRSTVPNETFSRYDADIVLSIANAARFPFTR